MPSLLILLACSQQRPVAYRAVDAGEGRAWVSTGEELGLWDSEQETFAWQRALSCTGLMSSSARGLFCVSSGEVLFVDRRGQVRWRAPYSEVPSRIWSTEEVVVTQAGQTIVWDADTGTVRWTREGSPTIRVGSVVGFLLGEQLLLETGEALPGKERPIARVGPHLLARDDRGLHLSHGDPAAPVQRYPGLRAGRLTQEVFIVDVGGALEGFAFETGDRLWRREDLPNSLVPSHNIDGAVLWTGDGVIGIEPHTGKTLWTAPGASLRNTVHGRRVARRPGELILPSGMVYSPVSLDVGEDARTWVCGVASGEAEPECVSLDAAGPSDPEPARRLGVDWHSLVSG